MTRTRTTWKVRDHALTIGERTLIMGVLNVTPDSFSDGGKYLDTDAAVERALEMEAQGADIIDIGAESTRPGSERINAGEELRRLVPVLKRLKGRLNVPISVDTYKVEVAEKALEHGASIINDVSALTWEPDLVKPVVQQDAGLILNHMRGTPETWARLGPMKDVMSTLLSELEAAIHRATRGGVGRERLVIDPGIGFGKRGEQNHEILARLGELQKFALPVLVAASRKSFLGNADDPRALEFATAAAVTTAILHGAAIVRVHDVAAMRPAVQAADAVMEATPEKEEKPRAAKQHQPAKRTYDEAVEEKRRTPIRPVVKQRTPSEPKEEEAKLPEPEPIETSPAPPPPRRPFERRADAPESEKKAGPPKKFFEWRDDRDDRKKPADRRGRPAAGPREDRGRDDRPPRPPFRRADGPGGGDRPERRPYKRADGPGGGDRPERRPYKRADGPGGGDRRERRPYKRADGPGGGDSPDRRPYQRADGPPNRGGRNDRDQKPYERRGAPSGGPPRKPFQRSDDDRRGGGGAGGGRGPFTPRDNDRTGGGRPPRPRNDDRGDRPAFGGPKRTGGGGPGGGRGPTKRPGGGPPPRGPRKRS